MKLSLLIAFCGFIVTAYAQQSDEALRKVTGKDKHDYFQNLLKRDSIKKDLVVFNFSSTPSPGIYRLPQDNMPCIVPDTKDITAMPNLWPSVTIPFKGGKMPNPAIRPKQKSNLPKSSIK
jgi:hypothetical protein